MTYAQSLKSRKTTIVILLILFMWAETDWGGCDGCMPEQSRGFTTTMHAR